MADATSFEAQFSPPWIMLRVGLSLVFCTLGLILMGLLGDSWRVGSPTITSVLTGATTFVFFGLIGLKYLILLCKGRPSFRVDSNGLLDRQLSDHVIPWDYISDVSMRQIRHRRWGITLFTGRYIDYRIDPDFERELSGFGAGIRRLLGIFNRGRPTILYNTLACDLGSLIRALRTIPPEHARLNDRASDGFIDAAN